MNKSEPKKTITLFCGGDVNLGRRMNYLSRKMKQLVGIHEMAKADCRLVNLECVVANKGEQRETKRYLFLHARPEQMNILTEYNVDIVTTANNHAGDYGPEALLEELDYLDTAGILHTGSGKNFEEAIKPVYKKVGDIVLAVFSVDSRRRTAASTADRPGTAYLPIDKIDLWEKVFKEQFRKAHEKAHVVIVVPHWGENFVERPFESQKKIGRLLIDLGADVVLGTHAHQFQGVENYKNRPIVYDMGDFLFDSQKSPPTACFNLEISSDGVEKITFIPLVKRTGQTVRAQKSAPSLAKFFIDLCSEFNTETKPLKKGKVEITFTPPPREAKVINDFEDTVNPIKRLIEPLREPLPEWTVDKVPDEAIIPPQSFGPLKLVGYHVPPECRTMTKVRMIYVETYWTIDEPVDKDYRLAIRGIPVKECDMPPFGRWQGHEFLDYMWPVNRWKPGIIYRERFAALAPLDKKREFKVFNVDLRMELTVTVDEEVIGEFKDPNLIKMQIEGLLYHNSDFDDIIYQSEPGKCWTAEQLAKVTGGEWIVPPPKDWYIQSFKLANLPTKIKSGPTLFVANAEKNKTNAEKLLEGIAEFSGAIIDHKVEGLPENFPVLKVANAKRAMFELGIAARKRFQGKVIGVTGSNGKTTTCNMLEHVIGDNHKVTATRENRNMYEQVPWVFAHVNPNDAYAILEINISSLSTAQGSITYDITPNVAVVTSVAPAHLAYKSANSMEGIAKFKSNIFYGMAQGDYAVINRDVPYYETFEKKAKASKLNIITFGTNPKALVRMPVLKDGSEFFIGDKAYKLSCPVPAEQLYDALATVCVSIALGIPVEKTLEHLKTFKVIKGRGNIITINADGKNLKVIDSTKNANPVSMKYALQQLRQVEPNRKTRVAILGDIARLGEQSIDYHKQLAKAMLDASPDRLLLCGEFMHYPYEKLKDKLNVTWFKTLEDLLKGFYDHLQDGDTVLVKSSQSTGLSKVVELLSKANASTASPNVLPTESPTEPPKASPALNIPKPLFDVNNFLPEGITPDQNGNIPDDKLKIIHCGGRLYVDAARAWLAMVRAAAQDKIFLGLNSSFRAYRNLDRQIKVFRNRYIPVEEGDDFSDDAIRVGFDGKIWQLKSGEIYASIPGLSSHGYGLAVDIQSNGDKNVKVWLAKNAEQFGFVQEYDFEPWHFTYIKAREGIPARVFEVEELPPEPSYTAEEIQKVSGGKWLAPPNENWTCKGMFYSRPFKVDCLAVVNQGDGIGITKDRLIKIARQVAGIICVNPEPLKEFNLPILVTDNINETINNLKKFFKKA